jgi:4a-hydroxytetrahydrobiopterin dehydratase
VTAAKPRRPGLAPVGVVGEACETEAVSLALTRSEASAATEQVGWRYLLGALSTSVAVDSIAQAVSVATHAVEACGSNADAHLRLDVRPDRVDLTLMDTAQATTTARDVELAHVLTDVVRRLGLDVGGVSTASGSGRPVQAIEIAIDAMDIPAIRPFWKAALAYVDEVDAGEAVGALIDPVRQGPSIWFQQMDGPRVQRNRIHLDVTVSHDEAEARVAAAMEAGGRLVSDAHARSFWVLADAEGNEVCVCTWQDRD